MNDTPPKKGLWTHPRQSRPEALLEGPKIFGRVRSLVPFFSRDPPVKLKMLQKVNFGTAS